MVKFSRKQSRRSKDCRGVFDSPHGVACGKAFTAKCFVNPITKNLFAVGRYDGEPFEAFLPRGKSGSLGGYIVVCDAIGRRDHHAFAYALARAAKFNKVK